MVLLVWGIGRTLGDVEGFADVCVAGVEGRVGVLTVVCAGKGKRIVVRVNTCRASSGSCMRRSWNSVVSQILACCKPCTLF